MTHCSTDPTGVSAATPVVGSWRPSGGHATSAPTSLKEALRQVRRPLYLVAGAGGAEACLGGTALFGAPPAGNEKALLGYAPPCPPQGMGDPSFCRDLGIALPYLGGSMAKGIASAEIAEELGSAGMLGFFGAAGLTPEQVEDTIERLSRSLGKTPHGFNLIHSPHDPELEKTLAEMYVAKGVRLVEPSAFLDLTLPLVRYRVHGITRRPDGSIYTPNRIVAKISREELAAKFFAPPPEHYLRELVACGAISAEQAALASRVPMAQDVTAEADSGGHTDNRPAMALFPTILSLAQRMEARYGYREKLRVGLGGGISTPASAAAAFAMGAAYLMTGSVNQACSESGTSDAVRAMLAETRQADVTMAPAADMFEMGVTVQVLKRGTMFPMRAAKLYEVYRAYGGIHEIPVPERDKLEKTLFQASLDDIWADTRNFFLKRDPRQVERAERDPKHLMALVFRWYLGQAAHWAKDGVPDRRMDYQVWCGPAMGAFNEWAAGSFLQSAPARRVATVALNILHGAASLTRANFLRCQGLALPPEAYRMEPLQLPQIKEYLG